MAGRRLVSVGIDPKDPLRGADRPVGADHHAETSP